MKILAFGEVMMRMMPPDYKTLVQSDILEYVFTGTGVNILSGLYQMGHDVYLSTRLPDNSVGKAATANIRKLGIKDDFIKFGGNHIGIYFLEKGIGNRASQVTYLNRKESSFAKSHIDDYDFSMLDNIDVLHICGISLALNEHVRDIVCQFIDEAKKRNIKVIFDCNFRPTLWTENQELIKSIYEDILLKADIVFAGLKDATLLLDIAVDYDLPYNQQLENALNIMSNRYNIEVIFGTIRGLDNQSLCGYMFHNKELIYSKTYPLTVYDRIGGGDGFAAGAIHGYLSHFENQYLIDFATASGVLAHTTYGDSPILGCEEIDDFIKNGKMDVRR